MPMGAAFAYALKSERAALFSAALEKVAPRAGFEPATCRLTVECSTAELPGIIRSLLVSSRSLRSERVIQMLDRFAKRFLTKKCTGLD